jgi:WD40 repeat protein
MRLITGDECGLLKETLPEQGEATGVHKLNTDQLMARKHGIVDLCWVEHDQDKSFAALSINNVCSIWERTFDEDDDESNTFGKYRKRNEISNIFDHQTSSLHPSNEPIGLHKMKGDFMCAINAAGKVTVLNTSKEEGIVKSFQSTKATDQDAGHKPIVTACAVHVDDNRLATGGNEKDLTLWDLSTGKETWKAKNAKPDPQTLLQQQVWPTSIAFLESNVVAVGSAHSEIRLYDIRQQRRPIALTPKGMWEHRITSLCLLPNSNQLVAGDSAGFLKAMDWREGLNQIVGRFVGPAGSIRAIEVHPEQTRLAVVGLDRMLRVYDYSTRKQLHCIYLRQRLNCVLVGQELSAEGETQDNDQNVFGNGDDLGQGDQVEDYVDSDQEAYEDDLQDASPTNDPEGSSSEEDSDRYEDEADSDDSEDDDDEKVQIKPRKKARR